MGPQGGQGSGHRSPMPGRVVKILANPGQAVVRGQALVVLEAMKMEHTVAAERDGVVATIHCNQGEQVAAQAVLLELEGTSDA